MPADPLTGYPFAKTHHDRLAERRDDEDFLSAAWTASTSRVVLARAGELAVDDSGDRLLLMSPAEAPAGERILLGTVGDVVYFAVLVTGSATDRLTTDSASSTEHLDTSVRGEARFAGLRHLASTLNETDAALAVQTMAFSHWHLGHPRCSVCGEPTKLAQAGASRRCPACGATHFPRTDPAVIMLVVDELDRCLLGHNSARAAHWFSTLAGFVEPGETPEHAVAREVLEETGVKVCDAAYVGSQPWPFPSSLMLGFLLAPPPPRSASTATRSPRRAGSHARTCCGRSRRAGSSYRRQCRSLVRC
ncbi:MAG: NAD(+) diphosphatase [Nocardioidaceae bacterium]